MKQILIIVLILTGQVRCLYAQDITNPKDSYGLFYTALTSDDISVVETQMRHVGKLDHKDTLAFSGAMKMKLAGLLKVPAEKLKLFRQGRQQLEKAIADDSLNVEYRFLRLIIQENSPPIMRYKSELEKDKSHILDNYNKIEAYLRLEIKKYSSTSLMLRESVFKNSSH